MSATALFTVYFVGGPSNGETRDYSELPASAYRVPSTDGEGDVEYLLYLFDVNDQPAWGFVARGTSMEEAQSRLAKRLKTNSEGEPA